uniref:Putative secreted protein n=1 Tax=Anopheles darlingi TaxID=43151 RepID=A0A2M4D2K2_ANODA
MRKRRHQAGGKEVLHLCRLLVCFLLLSVRVQRSERSVFARVLILLSYCFLWRCGVSRTADSKVETLLMAFPFV